MTTASTVMGSMLQPSFDKTAWLQSVRGKPADGQDLICCCRASFGDGSGMDEGQAIEHECSAKHKERVERHEGCSAILERIVYLAEAAAAAASTGKSKLWFIICKSAHHRAVWVVLPPPHLVDNIRSSRCLALAAAAAEEQYQKPCPHDQNRPKKRARNADQLSYPASLLVPARLSHASRALFLPIGKIAAETSSGNWLCKTLDFGHNTERLSLTHVETHEQSLRHK